MPTENMTPIWAWRHPRPQGAQGRCVGAGTDLAVHWRRAKRLARRIQQQARRARLPHCVYTSTLRRSADVGAWLRRWGWRHVRCAELIEMDFGGWDGLHWSEIAQADVDSWAANFARHAPGGGESLAELLTRAAAWSPPSPCLVVGHGGWMLARRWGLQPPPDAAQWPPAPAYGQLWRLD